MREKKALPKRHPHRALTAQEVKSARPDLPGKPKRIADGGGLYLLVAPNGSKSWVLRTLVKGRRCDIGLGGVETTTLQRARERALELRRLARDGGDPLAKRRRERRPVPTFLEAVNEVHAVHSASFTNPKHAKQWLASLKSSLDTFGTKPADAVESADILAVLKPLWLATPETGRRVLQRLTVVLDWCKAKGYRSGENPASGLADVLPRQRTSKAHHAALAFQDCSDFVRDLRASDASDAVKLAFEFTILCATRTSETLGATWDEVDMATTTWTIPASRMKARVDHRVPLSKRCVEILERAKAISNGGTFVFPGRTRSKPLSNMVFLMALRRMKRSDITAHGFRSSFRDWASERTGFPAAVCEAALAHTVRNKTEAAYNRTDLFERRRELMEQWASFISQGLKP